MKATSTPGSDSGRGADSPGTAALSSRSPSEVTMTVKLCSLLSAGPPAPTASPPPPSPAAATSPPTRSRMREQTPPGHPALEQNPSCLAPERLSVLERLVGQPSAHSSMIGARPGPPDRSGWDSTLSRMIGRLSQQSDSPGPGFCSSHDTSEPSWSDEIRMRVLVGELQVSADQHRENSGERSSAAESREPSGLQRHLAGSPSASNPGLQNRAGLEELDPHGADAWQTARINRLPPGLTGSHQDKRLFI
ncbi:hypothetical protein CCH79_00019651 [Gambusia affinis]|uniref:Uncharacterized protein n=1 Tax=Gambusia affinis TaxID=33528 RepID=A0A315VQR5_GAMAF|nr:hypothetical protein CCH79_00019651 [Gambusia affinis]